MKAKKYESTEWLWSAYRPNSQTQGTMQDDGKLEIIGRGSDIKFLVSLKTNLVVHPDHYTI